MELSMWIIADRLRRFLPEIEIASGKMEIRGARLLTGAEQIRDDMLYIAPLGDADRVLCRHGNDRLIDACRLGLKVGAVNYTFIKNTLTNRTERLWMEDDVEKALPEHGNIRGNEEIMSNK